MSTIPEDSKTAPNQLADRTGPFYDMDGITSWLGITEEEVCARVENNELLRVLTADAVSLFPIWQFNEDGTINPDLMEVIEILNSGMRKFGDGSGWTVVLWLSIPYSGLLNSNLPQDTQVDLESLPAYEHLQNGTALEDLKELARADANQWSS